MVFIHECQDYNPMIFVFSPFTYIPKEHPDFACLQTRIAGVSQLYG